MKLAILLVMIVFISNEILAQDATRDWLYAGKDSDSSVFYIKSEYVSKEYSQIKIWTKKLSKREKISNVVYKDVKALTLFKVDCATRQLKTLALTYYSKTGKLIWSYTRTEYESDWRDVVPESIGEILLNAVCSTFNE